MRLIWSSRALSDLSRLYALLLPSSRKAATQVLRTLRSGALKLLEHHRLGERVSQIENREVRRIFLRGYELRYEVSGDEITVLRLWHTREDR